MQNLFYGIVYGEQKTDQKDDYETLTSPDEQMIIQIHRKVKLLNEFKKYIEDKDTVYYRYIINTFIHEREYGMPVIYIIKKGPFFGNLYLYKTTQNIDDFFTFLMEL